MASSDPSPFPLPKEVDPWIIKTLVSGVFNNDLTPLKQAVKKARTSEIPQMEDWGVVDAHSFLLFASGMLNWVPSEIASGKLIYNTLCLLYFILDQSPLDDPSFSTEIKPSSVGQKLAPLSQWTLDFAIKVGSWMSTPASINQGAIESFQKSPLFNLSEAAVPASGWKNFNHLFARHLKPGMRPISAGSPSDPNHDRVVVFPADSTFDGAWPVDQNAQVNIKGLEWKISDLLQSSRYAEHFRGGTWMHAFLNTFDYHRQHAPVAGRIVEANVIQGLAYLQVVADPATGKLRQHRSYVPPPGAERGPGGGGKDNGLAGTLDAPDTAGYQFLQSRGCVIIENDLLGYVAVLPIGMAQVSSVKLRWEPAPGQSYPIVPNVHVKKGEEISHFEFGGSDIVLVFQKSAKVQILGAQGIDTNGNATSKQKYLMGMPLGWSTKTD